MDKFSRDTPPIPDVILIHLQPRCSDPSPSLASRRGRGLPPLLPAWGEGGASLCGGTWYTAGSDARTAELRRGSFLPLTLSWVVVKDEGKGGGLMFPADSRHLEGQRLVISAKQCPRFVFLGFFGSLTRRGHCPAKWGPKWFSEDWGASEQQTRLLNKRTKGTGYSGRGLRSPRRAWSCGLPLDFAGCASNWARNLPVLGALGF